jgi:hypothetical protein
MRKWRHTSTQQEAAMTNARIERMIREVNAEPASDFVVSFLALIERFWPKVTAATAAAPAPAPARLSLQ